MSTKIRNMKKQIRIEDIKIRTQLKPGDLGYIMHRHGKMYHEEYNYGIEFETYVGAGLHEFYSQYDQKLDRVWVCEYNELIVGFILLMHRPNNTAQLRYFYLEKEYRGIGLGKKLMDLFIEFMNAVGYDSAYLLTTDELPTAASLYTRHGFKLTKTYSSALFNNEVKEQRYELSLQSR